jgi:hypothetical protein
LANSVTPDAVAIEPGWKLMPTSAAVRHSAAMHAVADRASNAIAAAMAGSAQAGAGVVPLRRR